MYRSPLIHDHVSALNLWFNRLPPGGEATCCLGPIKALRTVKTRAEEPGRHGRRKRDRFPGCLAERLLAGVRVRCETASVFDERGKLLQEVHVSGPTPVLAAGNNPMKFRCEAAAGPSPRAKITAISTGVSIGNIPATPGTAR